MNRQHSFMESVVREFVDSKLTPLIVIASLVAGVFAIVATPREEEPQIIVPMMDVFAEMPGATASEVEQRVTIPMEKKIAEIPGVEYVYSTSMPGQSLVVVRFKVGEDLERALIRLYNKLYSNLDLKPQGVIGPMIKARSIDDVPILSLTLWSDRSDHYQLRRIAAEMDVELRAIPDVAETNLIGGLRRQMRVLVDPARMAAYHVDPSQITTSIDMANRDLPAGRFPRGNVEYLIEIGEFLRTAEEVGRLVVGVWSGRPVHLRDVAKIEDGPEEPTDYVLFAPGAGWARRPAAHGARRTVDGGSRRQPPYPAVTISVAKRPGTNAVTVADDVLAKVAELERRLMPADVHVTVTRNYGETAQEKSNELLKHLLVAVVSVTLLIAFFLGFRPALVVLLAVPVTLALTLLVYYLFGYTLNRVTLFALIFSIGILVDDPIVDVENIVRHFHLPGNKDRPLLEVTVEAVNEVRSPLILATLAVICAILPMAAVRGLMGPYMRPIPVGASTAMLLSMAIAFVVTPWAAYRLLPRVSGASSMPRWLAAICPFCRRLQGNDHEEEDSSTTRLYRRVMGGLIRSRGLRTAFLAGVTVLLALSGLLVLGKAVEVKMLPFDNKSELQIVIDTPEGTTLEATAATAMAIATYLKTVPEVMDYQVYVGTASPYNFNGLVRHYFLRRGCNVADIQVNLLPKEHRRMQSDHAGQIAYARRVMDEAFSKTPGVVDVDWYVEDPQRKRRFVVDREKCALSGVSPSQVIQNLVVAADGGRVGLAHIPGEREDVVLKVQVPRPLRSSAEDLRALRVATPGGMVPLSELARVEETPEPPYVYHKNLKRVVYVTGDVAGEVESPVYAILKLNQALDAIRAPDGSEVPRHVAEQPWSTERLAIKWDGEWQITYEVFRDLGLAFAAVLVLIYLLVVAWFQSFVTPLVILTPVPLSLIGILPAHWFMGAFFTATSMIGFIAGAGIVVRNSILLVDFIILRRSQGSELGQAVIDAGAIRFRPMLLTASAVIVGSAVMLFDPIFQG
ncbi:MAG: efflux RND transporter permease subunit, partial [Candidatus Riflebacteria bacterium]|nr:efflux RND transporter permease subunit [Candidatus Riflebacteria bacterium]